MTKVVIDPVTGVEGHLRLELELEAGVVNSAKCSGTLYRGIEAICRGRDPLDAAQLTQRICGLCSTGHGIAAVQAVEKAWKLEVPQNAKLIRSILLAGSFISSHVMNFYQMSLPDYLDNDGRISAEAKKLLLEHQHSALDMYRKVNESLALLAGKIPHAASIVVGGVTEHVTAPKILNLRSRLKEISHWLHDIYLTDMRTLAQYFPEYWEIGAGSKTYIAFNGLEGLIKAGVLDDVLGHSMELDAQAISEDVTATWTTKDLRSGNRYSWVKAPRYNGKVYETGPLARQLILGQTEVTKLGQRASSVWGRHWARVQESIVLINAMLKWLTELQPQGDVSCKYDPVNTGEGAALLESPTGALGHWLAIEGGKIAQYRIVSGSTWNLSPIDQGGQPGPLEQALMGLKVMDSSKPIEVYRVIKSFDPCMSCAVHMIKPGEGIAAFRIG